jgi:hypothetical protein
VLRDQTKRKPVETFSPNELQTFIGTVRHEWLALGGLSAPFSWKPEKKWRSGKKLRYPPNSPKRYKPWAKLSRPRWAARTALTVRCVKKLDK